MDRKADFFGALQGLSENCCRAPGDIPEKGRVKRLAGKEVIASIYRRPNYSPVARKRERVHHLREERNGQSGTVRIEHAGRSVANVEQALHSFSKAVPKTAAPNFVKRDIARKMLAKKRFTLWRAKRHRASKACFGGGGDEISGDILEESGIQACRFFEG